MNLGDNLDALFTSGFDQLYPVYGKIIDIVEYGTGDSYLLIQGTVSEIETNIKALVFPLSTYEREIYGTGFGDDSKKFVFRTETVLKTNYLLRTGTDMYEISTIVDRAAFGRYRVIAKKSEDV